MWHSYKWQVENLHYITSLLLISHPFDRTQLDFLYKEATINLKIMVLFLFCWEYYNIVRNFKAPWSVWFLSSFVDLEAFVSWLLCLNEMVSSLASLAVINNWLDIELIALLLFNEQPLGDESPWTVLHKIDSHPLCFLLLFEWMIPLSRILVGSGFNLRVASFLLMTVGLIFHNLFNCSPQQWGRLGR